MKLNENGLRLYPSTDSFGAGVKSGEIDVGIMWLARVNMWQNAGIPVKASFPNEGCVLYVSGMVMPEERAEQGGRLRIPQRHAGAPRRSRRSPRTWAICRPWTTRR